MRARSAAAAVGGAAVLALGTAIPAAAGSSGTETILVLQTKMSGSATVVARGPIHALGRDVTVNDTHDRFVFPAGALNITHHATSHRSSYDRRTCLGRDTETGRYVVTGGTGKYVHATGHGSYVVHVLFVQCKDAKPRVFTLRIDASGPLSY